MEDMSQPGIAPEPRAVPTASTRPASRATPIMRVKPAIIIAVFIGSDFMTFLVSARFMSIAMMAQIIMIDWGCAKREMELSHATLENTVARSMDATMKKVAARRRTMVFFWSAVIFAGFSTSTFLAL